jgi:peptidoglycan/LPS O-acetylase OafA/YrhL
MSFIFFSILFGHAFGTDFHTLVYGSILGRAIEFMLGMFMALHLQKLIDMKWIKFWLLVFVSYVVFFLWCTWYLRSGGSVSDSYLRLFQPIAESLFAFTLILFFQWQALAKFRHFWVPFYFVGIVSYPLYLTHLIVLDGIKRFGIANADSWISKSIPTQSVLIVSLSIVLAWIIHEAIEKPGMKLGRSNRVESR